MDVMIAQGPGRCQVFFNISKAVGVGCPNDRVDVELVQLGYYCSAINPANPAPASAKEIWKRIRPGEPYSGALNDPLTKSIEADEIRRGVKPDGHVSRMHGGGNTYAAGARGREPFLIVGLCNNISDVMQSVYPRIDLDSRCPSNLAAYIKNLLRN